jgi:ammonia channel protein AmtB
MPKAFLLLGVFLLAFGWWGMNTDSGRHQFDEMAGMIPMAALGLGGLTVVIALALLLWRR